MIYEKFSKQNIIRGLAWVYGCNLRYKIRLGREGSVLFEVFPEQYFQLHAKLKSKFIGAWPRVKMLFVYFWKSWKVFWIALRSKRFRNKTRVLFVTNVFANASEPCAPCTFVILVYCRGFGVRENGGRLDHNCNTILFNTLRFVRGRLFD